MAKEIGLVGKNVESVAPYFRRGTKRGEGVQIDLLIQLPRCIYVVEIKRKQEIGLEVGSEVERKVANLALGRGKSVKTVLVYDGELDLRLEEDGYFDYLVPFSRLLGRKGHNLIYYLR